MHLRWEPFLLLMLAICSTPILSQPTSKVPKLNSTAAPSLENVTTSVNETNQLDASLTISEINVTSQLFNLTSTESNTPNVNETDNINSTASNLEDTSTPGEVFHVPDHNNHSKESYYKYGKLTTTVVTATLNTGTTFPTTGGANVTQHDDNSTTAVPEMSDGVEVDSKLAIMPEPKPTAEPKPEPEAEPEAEPEVEPEAEPEVEAEPGVIIAEPTPIGEMEIGDAFAEPGPVWKIAKNEWGIAWHAHVYCFGGTFLVLSVYSLWNMIRICTLSKLLSRYYFLTLNFLMFSVCFFRAFYLIYDPYNSSKILQPILAYFLFNTGFPFFTSSFAVLFLSLLQATRLQMLSPKIQRTSILGVLVSFHFIFSIATDIIVGTMTTMSILVTVCQLMFIAWALLLSIGYFYIFRKLYRSACRSQTEIMRSAFTSIHIAGGKLPKKFPRPTLGSAVKITLFSAIFSMLTAVLQVYGLIHVYGIVASSKPQPWPWWIYQTLFRFLEVGMCSTMIYVGSRPLRHFGSKGICPNILKCCQNKTDYFDPGDIYPAHFSGHLQPIMTSRNDVVQFGNDHSLSLPGYTYRGNYLSDLSVNNGSSKTLQLRYVNAPTSNASVISAISSQKCNSFLPTARSEGVRSSATLSTAASGSRPSSMLIKDNGFIRFRQESDADENICEIEEQRNEGAISPEGKESIKPQIGSMPDENALNDDLQFNASPFFRNGYKHYYNYRTSLLSGYSADTTDFDGSDEQLSDLPVKCLENNQRIRKCGSTCSSESAGNSFDLSMFLNRSIGVQTNSSRPISVALSEDSRYRPISAAVTEDEDGSSVDGHEAMLGFSSRPEGLNLDLKSKRTIIPLHVINSPMQDITPDSAVYLDLNISKINSPETDDICPPQELPKTGRYKKNMSCSQSMNDLSKKSASTPLVSYRKIKKSTESLISRIKGSNFSLNDGYKPLSSKDDELPFPIKGTKLNRSSSERRNQEMRPRINASKYRSVCGEIDLDDERETLFAEDDGNDEEDSGAGGSREDITMTDEEVQTDPVVILQDQELKCPAAVSVSGFTVAESVA